jgi:hypothetical protein
MQRQVDIQILINIDIYFWLHPPCVYIYMYVSPPRQVDCAHVCAAERERRLAALATAQVRPPAAL